MQTFLLLFEHGETVEDTGNLYLGTKDVLLGCLPHTVAGFGRLLELQQQLLVSLDDLNPFVDEMEIEISLLQPGDQPEPRRKILLLEPLRLSRGDFASEAQLAREWNFLRKTVHGPLKRLHHWHPLIADLKLGIRERLHLGNDGFGCLPPLSRCLNLRVLPSEFLDETLEMNPVVTGCRVDRAIRAYNPTSLLCATDTQ